MSTKKTAPLYSEPTSHKLSTGSLTHAKTAILLEKLKKLNSDATFADNGEIYVMDISGRKITL